MRPRSRLLAAQAVASTGMAAGGTAGGLLASSISGSDATAALPLGAVVVGAALSAPAAAAITVRLGRTRALTTTYAVGAAGAALAVVAAWLSSLTLLLVGHLLIGAGNTALMLSRYAVADLATPTDRGRAISRSMAALTVGAIVGPNLLGPAGHLARPWGLASAAGLFVVALVMLAAAAALLVHVDSAPRAVQRPAARRTRGRHSASAGTAIAVLASANLTMVSVMAVAPVHLHAHGTGVGLVGVAISLHVAAMFAGSPIVGRLVDRHGAERIVLVGAAGFAACGLAPILAGSTPLATVGLLVALGASWNVQVVAGSALLQAAAAPGDAPRLEGHGEMAMGLGAAVGALLLAGPLMAAGGLSLLVLTTVSPHLALLPRLHRTHAGSKAPRVAPSLTPVERSAPT